MGPARGCELVKLTVDDRIREGAEARLVRQVLDARAKARGNRAAGESREPLLASAVRRLAVGLRPRRSGALARGETRRSRPLTEVQPS